ncbi:hypothetical protein [Arthrobacter sp. zg-Y1110]|uniref:hypothetical protein n=1 Tax=Arthrobacter sp. zg-Y1110 TaxID=2886932 RepID=UPI001D157FE1|nr:hypothetical protein [Arthrobacter sp. zg-Y1110]MCC3292389.1 hypothetical protein [Arthrobacter sp. zg-Y1110]UWX86708.1 hypothetical protein N2K99_17860 [Arthrobacter sp. zg-Y1110]
MTINTAPQPRESGGQYSFKTHGEAPVALSGAAGEDTIARLHEFADAQAGSTEGRGLANQARLSAAARNIHEGLPEAASFTLDKADGGYVVARAWDTRGYQLGEDDREYIVKHLREAGVGYIHTPVGLAEARKWEPDTVSPTSPKITSKGRTVFVTLPDGVVVDRTSKTKSYTHAIIASPEDTEMVRKLALVQADEHKKEIDDIDAALAEPLKIRSVQRFKTVGDPDVDRQGNPVYYNHEYRAYATDGKTVLKTIRGNSKQETQGVYDEDGKYHPDRVEKIFPAMKTALKERRSTVQGYVDKAQSTVDEIDNGTYNAGNWSAWGFSSSAANAEKTARSNTNYAPARRFTAVPIDQ